MSAVVGGLGVAWIYLAINTALQGSLSDNVCRSDQSGRGCGPAYFPLVVGTLTVIAILLNLVFTTRGQFKHTSVAFELSAESLTVRVGKRPKFSRAPTTWVCVPWKDLLAVHTSREHRRTQLDFDLRTGAVITTDDGAPLGIPLHNLYCGDPFRDAAVLQQFLSADRTRIGWTQVADEANRIAADASL